MDDIALTPMTKELARLYYRDFELDPDLVVYPGECKAYVCSDKDSDKRVERYINSWVESLWRL